MKNSVFHKYGDKLLFILALAVLATAIFRFGGKAIANVANPPIVFTQWWQDDIGKEALLDIIEEFEKFNEGIKIILNTTPYEDLRSVLLYSANPASADDISPDSFPGDIIALDPLWVPELLKKGIIEDPVIRVAQGSGEGLLSFINVLYYNIEILREAGFSMPPKSRGDFLNQTRALCNKEEGRWGLAMGGNSSRGISDDVLPWIWAAGIELIKDGKPEVNSRQVTESLAFLSILNSEGIIAPGAFSADNNKKLEDFILGRAAFIIAPASDIDFLREYMGDEQLGVTSVPAPDNYTGKTFFGSAAWTAGVYSYSAHKEEARLFLDFLASKTSTLSAKLKATPGYSVLPDGDSFYSKVWDIAIAGENARDFAGLPWGELEIIFKEGLYLLFADKYSPAETAGTIQAKWEAAILSHSKVF